MQFFPGISLFLILKNILVMTRQLDFMTQSLSPRQNLLPPLNLQDI